jgi:hypothetical protein
VVQKLEVQGDAEFRGVSKFQDLKIGTPENPQGITIYDKATGLPKCVSVENDAVNIVQGECN